MRRQSKLVAALVGGLLVIGCTSAVAASTSTPVECDITDNTLTCPLPPPPAPVTETVTADPVTVTTTVSTPAAPETLFGDTAPANPADPDNVKVELGVKFKAAVDGKILGVRFYKGVGNTGAHVGTLWTGATSAASVTFTNESATGWQTAFFASPVSVTAGTEYTASYLAPVGRYSSTPATAWPKVSGNLTGLQGVYQYNGGYPTQTFGNTHYSVDVMFAAGGVTPTTTVAPTTTTVATTASIPATSSATPTPTTSATTTAQPAILDLPREPWYGGVNYYKQFPVADAAGWDDAGFFPISVFLSKPSHAPQLKALGVNTYMGAEHDGSSLTTITNTGMFVLAQDEWTQAEIGSNSGVVGYQVSDECDMGYSGCTPDWNNDNGEAGRLTVQQGYVSALRARNDGRFLHANFGNGVLRTFWAPTTMDDHVQLMDSSSVDKYAYTSPHVQGLLPDSPDWPSGATPKSAGSYGWLQDQMERFQNPAKLRPNWVFVETAKPFLTEGGATTITVPQIGNAVWAAITHGANGLAYFQHNNNGTCGTYSLVDCSQALKDGVKAVNAQVTALAPVINTQSYAFNFAAGVDTMLKVHDGSVYVFTSLGLKQTSGSKTFTLPAGVTGVTAEVVGENRTVAVSGGKFTDAFTSEGAHHIYKVTL